MYRKYPRARWHDYEGGIYFITVNTRDNVHYFGEITDGEIQHTEIGRILSRAIEQIGLHYRNVSVDSYIVMPDHFHAIVIVEPKQREISTDTGCLRPPIHADEGDDFRKRNHFNATLSQAIGGVKSFLARQAHAMGIDFRWHTGFYDRIIRDQREYDHCVAYIENNVENWAFRHTASE